MTSNRRNKFEVEKSEVKVTGNENVKLVLGAYLSCDSINYTYPGGRHVAAVIWPCIPCLSTLFQFSRVLWNVDHTL